MPVLSVITVVKDDSSGLRRTLDSISQQVGLTGSEVEMIVVDGSSPSLESFVVDAGLAWVKYAWQQPQGIFNAMNFGISQAQGNYLYFLNAGDTLFDQDVLSRVIAILTAEEPMWLFGRVCFTSVTGRELSEPQWGYRAEHERLFARGLFPSHQGTIMQRGVVESLGGFDETYRITSDYHLMLKMSNLAEPTVISFPIARFQQGGASTQHWRDAILEFHRARISVYKPKGVVRVREWIDTGNVLTRTTLVRLLGRFKRG